MFLHLLILTVFKLFKMSIYGLKTTRFIIEIHFHYNRLTIVSEFQKKYCSFFFNLQWISRYILKWFQANCKSFTNSALLKGRLYKQNKRFRLRTGRCCFVMILGTFGGLCKFIINRNSK